MELRGVPKLLRIFLGVTQCSNIIAIEKVPVVRHTHG